MDVDLNQNPTELIGKLVEDLVSYDEARHKRVLDYYFFPDATMTSPLLCTQGVFNIRRVFHVWTSLNSSEPEVEKIIFDGQTCIVHLKQNLRPRIFPLLGLQIPAIMTLHFKETDVDSGLLKIYKQEDNWTLEGLIQSVPLISFWYDKIVRVIMGKLVTSTGDFLYSAVEAADKMTAKGREIHQLGVEIASDNINRLHEYRENLQVNFNTGVELIQGYVNTRTVGLIENSGLSGLPMPKAIQGAWTVKTKKEEENEREEREEKEKELAQ